MNRRPITQIHEIELSSRCNLACSYCPNPTMRRWKGDMAYTTWSTALMCVAHFCRKGTQGELALTGVGEALLHTYFADWLLEARTLIGPDRRLTFSTNGILLTDELLDKIAPARPIIFVSLHRPEMAGPALQRARARGLLVASNDGFATSALDWVGSVKWFVSHAPQTCEYLRSGWCVVRADGRVGACCWDAESEASRLATVWDDPAQWTTAPHAACERCSLKVPKEMFEHASA